MSILEIIFWTCLFILVYNYLLYPLLMITLAMLYSRKRERFTFHDELPEISVLIPAYNEEVVIEEKVHSVFKTSYPENKIKLIVASDCSSDKTHEIVNALKEQYNQLQLIIMEERTGKPGILNKITPKLTTDLVLFTDADVLFDRDTIFNMACLFKDQQIGLVDSRMVQFGASDSTYLSIESRLKHAEGELFNSMMGPFGGCFMIRRKLYKPVPERFTVDDFFIAMKILDQGYACINSMNAKSYERGVPNAHEAFRRMVRIASGNVQNLLYFAKWLIMPFTAKSFTFISHKVIRWIGPFLIISIWILGLILFQEDQTIGIIFLFLTAFLISTPLLVLLGSYSVILKIPAHLVIYNAALFVGVLNYIKGIKSNVWQPTARK